MSNLWLKSWISTIFYGDARLVVLTTLSRMDQDAIDLSDNISSKLYWMDTVDILYIISFNLILQALIQGKSTLV